MKTILALLTLVCRAHAVEVKCFAWEHNTNEPFRMIELQPKNPPDPLVEILVGEGQYSHFEVYVERAHQRFLYFAKTGERAVSSPNIAFQPLAETSRGQYAPDASTLLIYQSKPEGYSMGCGTVAP